MSPATRRSLRRGFGALVLLLIGLSATVPPAQASIDGPCSMVVQGQDLAMEGEPTAEAPADGNLTYHIEAPVPILRWKVRLQFGPFDRVILDRELAAGANNETGMASFGEYTKYGTGIYRLVGEAEMADGTHCSGALLLRVQGSPFSSAIGLAAVAVLGAAGVGLLLTILQIVLDAKDVVEAAKDFIEQLRHTKAAVAGSKPPGPPPSP